MATEGSLDSERLLLRTQVTGIYYLLEEMQMQARSVGCAMIVAGTSIGAGMLALPIVGGAPGFWDSLGLLFVMWLICTYTALLILEVCLALKKDHNSFDSMARITLGLTGRIIT